MWVDTLQIMCSMWCSQKLKLRNNKKGTEVFIIVTFFGSIFRFRLSRSRIYDGL